STVHVSHAHRPRASRWADDADAIKAMQQKVPQNMREGFAQIEEHYLTGPWVLGERFSVADIYLFVVAGWLESDGVDIAEFPRVAEHFARMQQRPSVAAAQTL
ncbi:MAG: glutathione S-transferase C-terminal domain-containing protein, partial [Aeromonas sp.]